MSKADTSASNDVGVAKRPRRRVSSSRVLGRDDWIAAARTTLIASGIERLKVELLAKTLNVTIGSFYHHFRTRDELLLALLEDWEVRNNDPIFAAVAKARDASLSPVGQFEALWNAWVYDGLYDPAYDGAVRAWSRGSAAVKERVKAVDERRIGLMQEIYADLGYDPERAFIRARVAYFHQIGYEALDISESLEERRKFSPLYFEILLG